jgi:hypothetical protein
MCEELTSLLSHAATMLSLHTASVATRYNKVCMYVQYTTMHAAIRTVQYTTMHAVIRTGLSTLSLQELLAFSSALSAVAHFLSVSDALRYIVT